MAYRELYVNDARRIEPLGAVYGSRMQMQFKVMDRQLSSGDSASVFVRSEAIAGVTSQTTGITINTANNTIEFYTIAGLFQPGKNEMQLDLTTTGGHVISFILPVQCDDEISSGGTIIPPQTVKSYAEQAQSAAASAAAVEANINRNFAVTVGGAVPVVIAWTTGFISADGSIGSASAYRVSDLIFVPAGCRLTWNASVSGNAFYCAEYTADGGFVALQFGAHNQKGERHGLKVDAVTDRYVRICTNINNLNTDKVDAAISKLPGTPETWDKLTPIVPSSMDWYTNYYIKYKGGFSQVTSTEYMTSKPYPLQKGQSIEFYACGQTDVAVLSECILDASFTPVRALVMGLDANGDANKFRRICYTADHDMHVRISNHYNSASNGNIVKKQECIDSVRFYYADLYHAFQPLNGKKVCIIGDSLTQGDSMGNDVTWMRLLELETGCTVFNHGIGYSSVSIPKDDTQYDHRTPMCDRYSQYADEIAASDFFLIAGGTNDSSIRADMGVVTGTDKKTFMGALNTIISGVRAINPKCQIMCITPWIRQWPTDGRNSESDFADGMIAVCKRHGVPVFDSRHTGIDLTDDNMRTVFDEGIYKGASSNLHFSPAAYERLYPQYRDWIESFVR